MLFDFRAMYAGGQAVLAGQSPYVDPNFTYPLPMAYFFAVWALFPFPIAVGLWWLASAGILVAVCRRAAWLWFLFPPVFAQFLSGQVDLFFLGLWALAGRGVPVALGLMTLKPYLCVVILPYTLWQWRRDTEKLAAFFATLAIVWLLPMLAYPHWPLDWLENLKPHSQTLALNSSAYALFHLGWWVGIPALATAVAAVVWSWGRGREFITLAGLMAGPLTRSYNMALIAGPRLLWRTVLAGWVAWLSYLVTGMAFLHFLILPVAFWEMGMARMARSGHEPR